MSTPLFWGGFGWKIGIFCSSKSAFFHHSSDLAMFSKQESNCFVCMKCKNLQNRLELAFFCGNPFFSALVSLKKFFFRRRIVLHGGWEGVPWPQACLGRPGGGGVSDPPPPIRRGGCLGPPPPPQLFFRREAPEIFFGTFFPARSAGNFFLGGSKTGKKTPKNHTGTANLIYAKNLYKTIYIKFCQKRPKHPPNIFPWKKTKFWRMDHIGKKAMLATLFL